MTSTLHLKKNLKNEQTVQPVSITSHVDVHVKAMIVEPMRQGTA